MTLRNASLFNIFAIILAFVSVNFVFLFSPKTVLSLIPGDANEDGQVNLIDYTLLSQAFGTVQGQPGYNPKTDFNNDGLVNILDFTILRNNFNMTASSTPTQTVSPPPTGAGIWISRAEIAAKPMTGTAWTNLRNAADGDWGTPDLKNQDNKFGLKVLAGALVYARTADTALRAKTRDGIMAAKRTMDQSSEWTTTNGALSLGRQLGTFAIAADIIDLRAYDSSADNEFRQFLQIIRTTNVGTHSRWKNLKFTCEDSTNNWGTFACPSRLAASLYLGDTTDVQKVANLIRAYFGERQFYPPDAAGQNGYFVHTSLGESNGWFCNASNWTGINSACTKLGVNIDGAMTDDAARGGTCCNLQGDGVQYSWEALQGLFVSAELIMRTGSYGNPYSWSNNALKRAMDHMQRQNWGIGPVTYYVPWMANKRYGTNYPTVPTGSGRIMSWTDWTHQ